MGAWHEALNLAALWELPIVFLVVNNEYGMGTSVSRASAEPELWRRAGAHRMHGERVDGDDLDGVLEAADRLMRAARKQRRPAVLEAITYRYRGHSVADAGLAYRTRDEIEARQALDPIARVRAQLLNEGMSEDELDDIDDAAVARVDAAVEYALASPEPDASELAVGMHAAGSAAQFAAMRFGSPFGEEELTFDAGLGR
jgi:pyruvate dehydrogenase E1 component alpha subunit